MKIILFSRPQVPRTAGELRRLFDALGAFGFDYAVNEEFVPTMRELAGIDPGPERIYGGCVGEQPEGTVMVCYGGDGTLLEGVHRLCGAPMPVLGINAGHLGFLTGAPSDGLDRLFGQIAEGGSPSSRGRCSRSGATSPGSPTRCWLSTSSPCSATARG